MAKIAKAMEADMQRLNAAKAGSGLSGGLGRAMDLRKELERGGPWLGAARSWMQSNIRGGDTLCWSSQELVSIPFCMLEDFALRVAEAAIVEDRKRRAV